MYANLELNAAGITYPFPAFQIWSGEFDGVNSTLRANGATVAAGKVGSAGLTGFTLGGLSTSGNYGYDFGHELIAEVLVYKGNLTDLERRATTDWLDEKYN